ncbi:MAG: TIGR01459 family HAD-type hydrolase [Rhizobiaceae bacterium]
MSNRIHGLSAIATNYSGILCDVWGVLHNGQMVYEEAAKALAAYRAEGGHVVMLTNSPRPEAGVIEQFNALGVDADAYDAVVTSGDATRELIRDVTGSIFHLGPERDAPLFDGLEVILTNEQDCDAIVCTGLFEDESETPDDYREHLEAMVKRNIPFICANPDVVVHRGSQLIWCAGSLANLYIELGGNTLVAGKPHQPIYDLAMVKMAEVAGHDVAKKDIIAIGDAMPTDVAGAQNNSFDLLYISAGIHYNEYGSADDPDEELLEAFLESHGATPTVWMPRLTWQKV